MNRKLMLTGITDKLNRSEGRKYSQVILFDERAEEIFGSTEAFVAECERRFKKDLPEQVDVYLIVEERLHEGVWLPVKEHRNEW